MLVCMDKPTSLAFTDFEVPLSSLFRRNKQGPMNLTWTRVQFMIPDGYEAPKSVEEWLTENTPGEWQTFHYNSPKGKTNEFVMVVRFKDKNDALMFKLRGGHQAWEG